MLALLWCRFAHRNISRPLPGGVYLCWTCLKRYRVPWHREPARPAVEVQP